METTTAGNKVAIIKNIYLYLVSFVALMMVVFSLADLINTALRTWVFTKADYYGNYYVSEPACDPLSVKGSPEIKPLSTEECDKRRTQQKQVDEDNRIAQRQRDMVRDISMIVVGVPVFIFHWMTIRKKEKGE
jgi:hypothetical protein